LAFGAGTASTSFAGLLDFFGGVGGEDSAGTLGAAAVVSACATVMAGLLAVLVSPTGGVSGLAATLWAGFTGAGWEATT
jgi:hypothetical protein